MTSIQRKFARKKQVAFMKEFKKSMKKFKKMVRCSSCQRHPSPGEKIDNWHIDKYSEHVNLICEDCFKEIKKDE